MADLKCELCGGEMPGWKAIALIEKSNTQFENDHFLLTIPVCWTCRHELDLAMRSEMFTGVIAKCLRKIIDDFNKFKDVINRQNLEDID